METYKSIVTLTWKFDSNLPEKECLEKAKKQIDQILQTRPQGYDFEGFTIQVELAKMKSRKKLKHICKFDAEEIFSLVTNEDVRKDFIINGNSYKVRMNSDRFHVFKKNSCCVSCGIEGKYMVLDMNPGDSSPHFNLYAEEDGRLVLMTKDHILAKSKGGLDVLENFQTMCIVCNNLKGSYDLSLEDCRELRRIHNNNDKLPQKELRDSLNNTREKMAMFKSI